MNKNKLIFKFITFDLLAALIVWILFMLFRKVVNDGQVFEHVRIFIPNYNIYNSFLIFPLSCIFVHYLSGYYLNPDYKSKTNTILTTIAASTIISFVIFFVLMLDDIVVSYEYYYYSLLVLLGLLFLVTVTFRLIIQRNIRHNYRTKKWTINTIIIGNGKSALKIANEINKTAERNTLVGFVTTNQHLEVPKEQILGNLSQLASIINKYNIKDSVIVLDNPDEQQLFTIINSLYQFNIDIRFTPRLYEILTGSARIGSLGTTPLVSITSLNMNDWETSLKRFMDLVLSFLALLFLSPIFLYFAIAIKRNSKGPVFYKQERIGRHGLAFNIVKFRTMYVDAENGIPKLSSADDTRITPVGRILRKYRFDELPQFWNILKGDMSLVGPRPERKYFINQIIELAPYYCLLYKIRPGLTSWGPIKIGYSDTLDKMIERLNFDIIYLDNMSLLTDLKILLYTIEIIFKGKGM